MYINIFLLFSYFKLYYVYEMLNFHILKNTHNWINNNFTHNSTQFLFRINFCT